MNGASTGRASLLVLLAAVFAGWGCRPSLVKSQVTLTPPPSGPSAGLPPVQRTGGYEQLMGDPVPREAPQVDPAVVRARATGPKRLAVLLVKFSGKEFTFSKDEIRASVFGTSNSVAHMFLEASYGKLQISGDVLGPVTIDSQFSDQVGCNCSKGTSLQTGLQTYQERANAAAAAAGFPVTGENQNYDYVTYIFTESPDGRCVGGVGEQGGRSSYLFDHPIFSLLTYQDSIAHELGHNLGLTHANGAEHRNVYNDESDNMGLSQARLRTFNAPHRIQLGWLEQNNLQEVPGEGIFTLNSLDEASSGVQALVIPKQQVEGNLYPGNLYVSFRHPEGYSRNLVGWTEQYGINYMGHANIHSWNPQGSAFYTCTSSPLDTKTRATLEDGETFIDWESGIRITQLAHTDKTVTIQVRRGQSAARDTVFPTVSFVSPINNTQVTTGTVEVRVRASDDRRVSSVSLFGSKIGSIFEVKTLTAPNSGGDYLFQFDSMLFGRGSAAIPLRVLARDEAGNVTGGLGSTDPGLTLNLSVNNPSTLVGPITPPSNLTASFLDPAVRLSWSRGTLASDPSVSMDFHSLKREDLTEKAKLVNPSPWDPRFYASFPLQGDAITYRDTGVIRGHTYQYRVHAYLWPLGNSAPTPIVTITVPE